MSAAEDASQPPEKDQQIERVLLNLVPWEARKKGGAALQDCLRDLWETAVRIGFDYAEKNMECTRKQGYDEGHMDGVQDALEKSKSANEAAAASREKELEEERVWGFEVGWRLCEEKNKVRIVVPVEVAVQTDSVVDTTVVLPTLSTCTIATQTDVPVAVVPPLDWAEDAGDLPTQSLSVSPLPPPPARDFSCLRSGVSQPFSSLQRRHRRSHSMLNPRSRRTTPCTQPTGSHPQRRSVPHPRFAPLRSLLHSSTIYVPVGAPLSLVDWDRDPRLHDLSRALTALGWVRWQ